jgi:hypothetical protein
MQNRRQALLGFAAITGSAAAGGPAHAQFGRGGGRGPGLVRLTTPDAALAETATLTTVTGKSKPPAGARILRPFLSVQVIPDESAEVSDRMGRNRNAGVDMRTSFTVAGLDDAGIQTAVDGLYTAVLKRVADQGFQIVPDAELLAHERARRLYRGGQASGWRTNLAGGGSATFFAPAGDTLALHPSVDYGFGALRQGFSGGNWDVAMDRFYATRDLQAGLIGIHLAVRFVDVQTWGGGQYSHLFGEGSGSIRSRAQVAFSPGRSQLYAYPKDPVSDWMTVALAPMAALPGESVTAFEDVTSNATKADALLGTALSALAGGSRSYSRKDYKITVDAARFSQGLGEGGDALAAAFLARMAQGPASRRG